jgi:hypothetical protein
LLAATLVADESRVDAQTEGEADRAADPARMNRPDARGLRIDRPKTRAERIATVFAAVGVVALLAVVLAIRDPATGLGEPRRTAAEQSALLASGECALASNHRLLGKVSSRLTPTRFRPRGGYMLESIERKRSFPVEMAGVRVVPCQSLARTPPAARGER